MLDTFAPEQFEELARRVFSLGGERQSLLPLAFNDFPTHAGSGRVEVMVEMVARAEAFAALEKDGGATVQRVRAEVERILGLFGNGNLYAKFCGWVEQFKADAPAREQREFDQLYAMMDCWGQIYEANMPPRRAPRAPGLRETEMRKNA